MTFYGPSHFLEKGLTLKRSFRPTPAEHQLTLHLVWGLQEQDMSSCDKSAIKCLGKMRPDNTFDINPVRAQVAMMVRN